MTFYLDNDNMVTSDMHSLVTKETDVTTPSEEAVVSRFELISNRHNIMQSNNEDDECFENKGSEIHRKPKRRKSGILMTISHYSLTTIDDVGLQLWRGSLLLADFLLHKRLYLEDKVIIELGGGVGLIGIVLSLISHNGAYITDYRSDIVKIAQNNIKNNEHLVQSTELATNHYYSKIHTRVLDCSKADNPRFPNKDYFSKEIEIQTSKAVSIDNSNNNDEFIWTPQDTLLLSSNPMIIIAADVIYDDVITFNIFKKASQLLRNNEIFWLTLEKRFNFDIDELSLIAHGYRKLLQIIQPKDENGNYNLNNNIIFKNDESSGYFIGELQPIDFPQLLLNYDRIPELELWEIRYVTLTL
eukprot:gene5828-11766_t